MGKINRDSLNTGKKILVFTTDWCGDCIVLKGYIDEVIAENPEWDFVTINPDNDMEIAEEFKVMGIPSFVALDNGERVSDLISKDAKPKSLINNWIKTIGII